MILVYNVAQGYRAGRSRSVLNIYRTDNGGLIKRYGLVVHCSGNSDLSTSDTVHSNFSLNSTSERLYLTSAAQQRVTDYVWLHDIFKDWTVGRMDGQSGFFYLSSPSPMILPVISEI